MFNELNKMIFQGRRRGEYGFTTAGHKPVRRQVRRTQCIQRNAQVRQKNLIRKFFSDISLKFIRFIDFNFSISLSI